MTQDSATPERLMDAAERLLAERGSAATSVRDVLAEAGVANASAVGYYFGSKDGLIAAVERRAVEQVNAERAAGLTALDPGAPLEDLVRSWVAPVVRLRCAGRGRPRRGCSRASSTSRRKRWAHNGAHEVMEVGGRYLAASAPQLPGLDRHGLLWRWQAVTAVMAFYCHGALEPFGPHRRRPTWIGTWRCSCRRAPRCCVPALELRGRFGGEMSLSPARGAQEEPSSTPAVPGVRELQRRLPRRTISGAARAQRARRPCRRR
jgi:AcrR family transcriptional regulator